MSAAPALVNPAPPIRPKNRSFPHLLKMAEASDLRPNLIRTFAALGFASKHGPDMWASVPHVADVANFCDKTIRRHLKRLCKSKVIYKKYEANVRVQGGRFRHSATYAAHPRAAELLRPRKSWWEHRRQREARNVTRPPADPPELDVTPMPAQLPARQQRARQLSSAEAKALVAKALQLEHGTTHDGDRLLYQDDPQYRKPLSRANAVVSACLVLQIPLEAGRACLRQHGWHFDDEEKPQGP